MNEEHYWSLVLEPGWIQAAIWVIEEKDKARVISVSPVTRWETEEELITAADACLSASVQSLPDDTPEPSKTVFGVPPSWVQEGQIKKEHVEKIRTICNKLSLEPAGFVVLSEAIAYFVKSQEGAPLSSVVVGVGHEELDVALFKLGNLSGSVSVARSVSVVEDVVEGLARFGGESHFPSRFIIYNGKEGELEEVRQALIAADWGDADSKGVKFLHTPNVEIFQPEKKAVAVCLAGASEIGGVTEIVVDEAITHGGESGEKLGEIFEHKEEKAASPAAPFSADFFSSRETEDEEPSSAQDFGFTIGKDISGDVRPEREVEEPKEAPMPLAVGPVSFAPLKKFSLSGIFEKAKRFASKIKFGGHGFAKDGFSMGEREGKRVFIIGLGSLLALIVAGFLFWWFVPKATVTLYVSPRKLEGSETLTISSKISELDAEDKRLPGRVISVSASGEKSRNATGTKTVGERSKGEVTVYRVGSETSLPAGTSLSSGDLKFTTDEQVSIASGSATSPATSKVKVTASDIGAEYNLANGTTFQVGNFSSSDIEAKNESDFSGGSSREIQAVSADDRKFLDDDLIAELKENGKNQISSQLTGEETFVEEALTATASAKNFSHKVGDEASSIKLTMTAEVSGLIVKRQDLDTIVTKTLESQVPSGFVLRPDQVELSFSIEDEGGGEWEVEVEMIANLLPELSPEEIAKTIAGKLPSVAEGYFSTLPSFVRAEIRLNPKLPGRLGTLPRVVKNISVEIAAER